MTRNQLFLSALIYLFSFSGKCFAQSYSFSQLAAGPISYSDLAESIPVNTFNANGAHVIAELEGETFWFYGIPFTFGGDKTIAMGDGGFTRAY